MRSLFSFFILTFILQLVQSATKPCEAQQIHIALSDAFTSDPATNNTIKAIFHTIDECSSAYISLKTSQGTQKIQATAVNFFNDTYSTGSYSTYVHIFDFPQLEFSQTYEYSCFGSDNTFLGKPQGPFKFYLPSPNYDGKETRVVMFADMDHFPDGMTTINGLGNLSLSDFGSISAFIHVGDMAYNLTGSAGKRGDNYMNTIQKFTAIMPYMVTAGNHEEEKNFSNFNMRFQMPMYEESQNHYYSFNLGNMHFVSFNLDLVNSYPETKGPMLTWLEQDLAAANSTRDKQPWIIAYAHQPLYCSYKDNSCPVNAKKFAEFEDLLIKYNVDLVVGGHVHFYERMLPIKKGAVAPFQLNEDDQNFTEIINPEAPLYILQGIAGHRGEANDSQSIYKGKSFSVKVSKTLSYLSVRSQNSTHLLVENMRSDDGTVEDYFSIVRRSFQEEPINETNLTNTTEPVNATESDNVTESNNTTESSNATNPINATEPSYITESSNATNLTNTTEPVNSTGPSNVTNPMNITEPTNSTNPTNATEPSHQTEPRNVTFPSNMTLPNNTTLPSNTTQPRNITELSDETKSDNSASKRNGFFAFVFTMCLIALFV